MTAEQIAATYVSPNEQNNIRTRGAVAMGRLMASWGMPYDAIVAQAQNPRGPAGRVTLAEINAAGVAPTVALNYYGLVIPKATKPFEEDDPEAAPIGYNIGEEILLKNNTDNLNWFCKVYCEHHAGATMADAEAAFEELPALKAKIPIVADELVTAAWAI